MKKNNIDTDILKDMVLLYELSLSIGQSLDLFENIEKFVTVLVSRKNLTRVAVWIKKSELSYLSSNDDSYELLYNSAPGFIKFDQLDNTHPVIQELNTNDSFQTNSQLASFKDYNFEHRVTDGTLLFYKLGNLGFIKLYDSVRNGFSDAEVNKLKNLIQKFTVSIEACLYYNRTLYEKNEREKAEQHIRLLFNSYPFPVIIYNLDNNVIIEANESMLENYHIDYNNISDHNITEFVPENLLPHKTLTKADYKTNNSSRNDWTYQEHGNNYHKEIIGKIINYRYSYAGFVTVQDHSERIKTLNEKKISDEKYKYIFNSIIDTYAEVDYRSGKIIEITPSIKNFLGYTREELIDKRMSGFFTNKDQDELLLHKKLIKNNGQLIDFETTLINKEGTHVPCSFSISMIYDNNGKPLKTVGTMRDITHRKKTELALTEAEKRWRTLINNSPDQIMAVKPDGTILFQNTNNDNEVIGKSIFNSVPTNQVEKYKQCLTKATKYNNLVSDELESLDKKWTLSRFVPVFNEQEQVDFIMIIATDITAQKDLERQLNKATKEAKSANQAKSRFLANMSHEIRNPMSAIIGNAELLTQTNLDNSQEKLLKDLMFSADNLHGLIDNILDLSKIEANQLILEKSHFNLAHEIENIINSLQLRATQKHINLSYDIDYSVPDYIFADRLRINQILLNLFDNSLKFTEDGDINLECQVINSEKDTIKLSFTVRDTGSGIDMSKLENLYDTNMTDDAYNNIKKGGAGLGLPIAKQLIELMNGEIRVESVKYVGTIVHFSILVDIGQVELAEKEKPIVDNLSQLLIGKTILIVEDDLFNQEFGSKIIKNWGGEVLIAENGFQAIEVVTDHGHRIDLIFMDLRMPIMDGIEATKMIRNQLNWHKPIVALTGEALKEKIEECYRAGMNDYISKPFKQVTIENKLKKFLFQTATTETSIQKEEEEELDHEMIEYSTEFLMEMIGDDPVQLHQLLKTYVKQNTQSLKMLLNAVEQSNWDQIVAQAHTIKTSFKYLSLIKYADICQELEDLAKKKEDLSMVNKYVNQIEKAILTTISQINEDLGQ